MSIFSTTKQEKTITEGWRALELFTDRHEASRCFIEYVNLDPPREQILFFYGDGGNGKSLLLRFLRESCCKCLSYNESSAIHQLADRELVEFVAQASEELAVPSAYLDFGMPPRGEERPQEAFRALLMLRRQLAGHGLPFPLYDFATILYLQKTNQLSDERLRTLFPADEIDFMIRFANDIFNIGGGALIKSGLGLANHYFRKWVPSYDEKQAQLQEWWTLYLTRRQITADDIAQIQRMDAHKELVDELPRLFAQDLNVAMTMNEAPKRVVLFFDTHEAFWGQQRHLAHDLYFQRDEWLRCLLGNLDFKNGIVAVCAGREAPRWHNASRLTIPKGFLKPFLIGHFSESDACEYLAKAGVSEPDLQHALVDYTQVAPDQIHPFYLGLSVDVIQAAQRQGQTLTAADFAQAPQMANKQQELLNRFLRYADIETHYAVRALSACRAFDYQIYRTLGQKLDFPTSRPTFEQVLTCISFVWQAEERADGWYRIHDLVRHLLHKQGKALTRQAHTVLEAYYRQQPNESTAIAEAIYHANRLEWQRGVNEWVECFDKALELSHYDFCGTLLEVRRDLTIENDFELGRVSHAEGRYFAQLSRHAEARQEYQEAINAYQKVLHHAPDHVYAHNNQGNVYQSLGKLQASLSEHNNAQDSYQDAIAAFSQALSRAPNNVAVHDNLGSAYLNLGKSQAKCSEYETAQERYRQAIAVYDKALYYAPDDAYTYNNQGGAYLCLGELQALLSEHYEARTSYQKAIAAFDKALSRALDNVVVHLNLGLVYWGLGKLQASFSEYSEARVSYQNAIAAFDKALLRAPNHVYVHNNQGLAYQNLGELQASLSEHSQALASYQKAITAFDKVLHRAPDYVAAHLNLGTAYSRLGKLQASLSEHSEALTSYQNAIAAYDKALQHAPNDVAAYSGKGIALVSLGQLQASLSDYSSALASYQKAIAAFDKALHRAPDDIAVHNNQGIAYQSLGELQIELGEQVKAVQSFEAARAACNRLLEIAPNNEKIQRLRDDIQAQIEQVARAG